MNLIATDFDSTTARDANPAKKPSRTTAVSAPVAALAAVKALFANARKASSERHLRAELAAMDDNLLRDIGVAEDEIYLIRAGQVFTPRAWNRKSASARGV
jgi:uncharacterized protein YjiS (DUF1127 family)